MTYVFDPSNPTAAPVILNGRINGNIHVEGVIDQIGSSTWTEAAVATDFGFNISARKNIRIYNDLQYEDAIYYGVDASSLTTGTTVVANRAAEKINLHKGPVGSASRAGMA